MRERSSHSLIPNGIGPLSALEACGRLAILVLCALLTPSSVWAQEEHKARAPQPPPSRIRRPDPAPRRIAPAPGWEGVPKRGFEFAEQAAGADAMERLAQRIEMLRLSPTRRVEHFAATSPAIRSSLREPFPGVKLRQPMFSSDQICSIRAVADLAAVVDYLKLLNRRYGDGRYDDRDFDLIWSLNPVESLEVLGQGVPSIHDTPRRGPIVRRGPTWADLTRRETGRGQALASERGSVSGKLVAARRAREQAREKLALYARRLPLFEGGDTTVNDELNRNPTADLKFQSWIRSARTVRTDWDRSGNAYVEIEAELRELWDIVAPHYRTPPPVEFQIRINPAPEKKGR